MKQLKKSTGILAAVILIVMISGLLLANQMIDHLENNITTDYTKVYHDDLNRLLMDKCVRCCCLTGQKYG